LFPNTLYSVTNEMGDPNGDANDEISAMVNFSPLHDSPTFVSPEFAQNNITTILYITFALSIFSIVSYIWAATFLFPGVQRKSSSKYPPTPLRASFQYVNIIFNAYLAYLGVYYLYFDPLRFDKDNYDAVSERIQGWDHLAIISNAQIAFQLWSIPHCVMLKEGTVMMIHHIFVLIIALMSAFFTNGFRFYTAFFYGIIEISSVPLSTMNMLESHDLSKAYLLFDLFVKISFSICFIQTRVIMWNLRVRDFVYVCTGLLMSATTLSAKLSLSLIVVIVFFLTCLQLMWAGEIMKEVLKIIGITKRGGKRK